MKVVVGVDSGGSKTRALAVSLEGERAAYAETGGGHLQHDASADENLSAAIRKVSEGHEIVRLVAGVAGLNGAADEARIASFLDGFAGVKTLVNDAAVAHFAAFGDGPGIVSIQGTGSTIRAVLEDGRVVRNGDFMHYAAAGAVRVGLAGVQMILTNSDTERDVALWNAAFDLWEVASPEALRTEVGRLRDLEVRERSRRLGEFARAVTASAEAGWLHSGAVCWTATKEIVRGIRLLGPSFVADSVEVALFGACGRSPAMRDPLTRRLARAKERRYRIVEPDVKPVAGAVLMALRDQGMAIDEGTIRQTSGSWCAPNDEER